MDDSFLSVPEFCRIWSSTVVLDRAIGNERPLATHREPGTRNRPAGLADRLVSGARLARRDNLGRGPAAWAIGEHMHYLSPRVDRGELGIPSRTLCSRATRPRPMFTSPKRM